MFLSAPTGDTDDEGWIQRTKDWVIGKIEDIFGDLDDVTLEDITGWITGILGPVAAGIILQEVEGATNTVRDKIDDILFGVAPTDDENCIETEYFEANKEKCTALGYLDCDASVGEQGQELTGGIIGPEETTDGCQEIQDPQCIGDGRWDGEKCVCPDGSDLEGQEEPLSGDCSDDDTTVTGTECQDPHRDTNDDGSCADTCKDGTLAVDGVLCPDPNITTPEECEEGEVRRGGLDDGRCVRIGEACFSEPGKYSGDDGTIAQGQINSEGFCTRAGDTETPTDDELCSGPQPPQTQDDKIYCFERGYSPCPEGTEEYQNGRWYKDGACTPIETDDCSEITADNYEQCGKVDCFTDNTPGPYVDDFSQCPSTGTPTGCQDPNATNQGEDGPCECPPGFVVSSDGTQCLETGGCTPKGEVIDSGCDGTTFFIRFSSGEVDPNTGECGEIYDSVPNYSGCAGGGICNDPNAVNDGEEGTCECKPGFTKNAEGLCFQSGDVCDNGATVESGCDTCPDGTNVAEYEDGKCPTSTECNDCTCAAYAAANPQICGGVPPVTPPSSGGGGGGVGGGVGAFSPFIAGIEYTPQPLPAAPAAPQKDYMAELDNLIKRNLFEGIV